MDRILHFLRMIDWSDETQIKEEGMKMKISDIHRKRIYFDKFVLIRCKQILLWVPFSFLEITLLSFLVLITSLSCYQHLQFPNSTQENLQMSRKRSCSCSNEADTCIPNQNLKRIGKLLDKNIWLIRVNFLPHWRDDHQRYVEQS